MRIEKCYVCGANIYPGHGSVFVRNDATTFRFCRSKCIKAFRRKRNPRYLRWTKAYRKAHGKELAHDLTFAFEKQRHIIPKYDREMVRETLAAMERVAQVQQERQAAFHSQRMRVKQRIEQREAAVELNRQRMSTSLHAIEKLSSVQRRLPDKAVHPLVRKARAALVAAGTADVSGIGSSNAVISADDHMETAAAPNETSE